MSVVDNYPAGHILSLAARSQITSGGDAGSVHEPASVALLFVGMEGLALGRRGSNSWAQIDAGRLRFDASIDVVVL